MKAGELGRAYHDGEIIIREGEPGDRMYVIQSGRVAVTRRAGDKEVVITELGKEDIFGEMALFDRTLRSATVRAAGNVRVLSIDKKTFLNRVHANPSLAYRVLQQMSQRIRAMDTLLAELKERAEAPDAAGENGTPGPAKKPGEIRSLLRYFARWAGTLEASRVDTSGKTKTVRERRGTDRRALDRRKARRRQTDRRLHADRRKNDRRQDDRRRLERRT